MMNTYIDKVASLTPLAQKILCAKATERPHTGAYNRLMSQGTYLCRRCGLALFRASSQFESGCGWPSFDDEIANMIQRVADPDGSRTEIVCGRCAGHLGHVFHGELLTPNNLRHCVNSASIDFVSDSQVLDTEEAIIAGGCFWGVDYFIKQIFGVLRAEVGYIGGTTAEPDYEQVCRGRSGHYEAVRVLFDKEKADYHTILKRFFEIHDPSQQSGQGPDIGQQYQSAIFYYNQEQLHDAQQLVSILEQKKIQVATRLLPMQIFWPAEEYHQNYYAKHHKLPYCHQPVKRFD